jgi:hypothetical protein
MLKHNLRRPVSIRGQLIPIKQPVAFPFRPWPLSYVCDWHDSTGASHFDQASMWANGPTSFIRLLR